ncbi:MAG: sodium:solute symporter family transporter [Ignavibacteriaceae bacterium]
MKSINFLDYSVVAIYFLFMLGIGFYFSRANKGAKEYFTGGSMIPWWMSGMTLYIGNFSAWTFTGAAGFAYSTGLFAILYFGTWSISYFVGSQLTAAKWRRTRSISPVEYTYTRFNITTQQFLGWIMSANYILAAGVQLAATCEIFAPVMRLDISTVILVMGTVILLYTLMGGLWAVSITDVVQGVILLSVTLIVMPLSLHLVGGFGGLLKALPAFSLNHMYNGIHYDPNWLVGVFVIMSLGTAAGQAQRFYSVKDERDAKRVGRMAGILFLTVPFVFGIPPLVARVIWPNLDQIPFFHPYVGHNPQDLVFVGLCLKLLPNGVIGVFLAAMLAATMSALSTVYNLVSSILSRDIYQGLIDKSASDQKLLKVGRISSALIGIVVIGEAIIFVKSKIGIFNMMQVFFTMLNIPVVLPIAFGLLIRKASRWAAIAVIVWGLIVGITTRYVLGWTMGEQIYAQFVSTLILFALSYSLGILYKRSRGQLAALSSVLAIILFVFFLMTASTPINEIIILLIATSATALGTSLFIFSRLFGSETEEQKRVISEFFKKLDTPVDVIKEVFGAGRKEISTFPVVGVITMVMGILISLIFFSGVPREQEPVVGILASILFLFGAMMWFFGKRSQKRAAQLLDSIQKSRKIK